MKSISIVIPSYNEEKTIGKVVKNVDCYFSDINHEIIVVDDGSDDGTPFMLGKLNLQTYLKYFKNRKNLGHAKTLIRGLKEVNNDYILYLDADDQIKPEALDFDLICGYRIGRQDKLFRKIISSILKLTIFFWHGYWIRDANCPFKLFKRSKLNFLMTKLPTNCLIPSVDFMILARRYNLRIFEIPVKHHPYIEKRSGTLQSLNRKSLKTFLIAFWEIITL